jgi:hypothetical protein
MDLLVELDPGDARVVRQRDRGSLVAVPAERREALVVVAHLELARRHLLGQRFWSGDAKNAPVSLSSGSGLARPFPPTGRVADADDDADLVGASVQLAGVPEWRWARRPRNGADRPGEAGASRHRRRIGISLEWRM